MAIPDHYSYDITERCQFLIRELEPLVSAGLPGDGRFGGSVRTTLLLALATPMIVLPVERLFKPGKGKAGAADDTTLVPQLSEQIAEVLGAGRSFGEAPFVANTKWSYVKGCPTFNTADYWPNELLTVLGSEEAIDAANKAPASRIIVDLRNALAHGGVTYLDRNGRNTDEPAAMFAFASARMNKGQVIGLNILRVSEIDFLWFLMAWADWLRAWADWGALNGTSAI